MTKLTAVVTGGTRGIGLAIAVSLLKRHASLAVTYGGDEKSAEKARQTLKSFLKGQQRILIVKGDVGDPKTTAEHHRVIRKELGPVNVLVNNAGIFAEWSQEKKALLKEKTFVPRIGKAADVVCAFEYIIDSPFETGVTLDVNGGAFMI